MCAQYNRKDSLYQKAKEEGYRSRAAYKLLEIDEKHRLIAPSSRVLDLGSWPGGWIQVIVASLSPAGIVIGVDLKELDPLPDPRVKLIKGDVREEQVLAAITALAGGKFDLVVSDMSPQLTGIVEADQAASVGLGELALWVAQRMLKPGGNFVCKLFKGGDVEAFVKSARPLFTKVVRSELKSTRKSSNEFYLIGLDLK